jgi:hypothetical protein
MAGKGAVDGMGEPMGKTESGYEVANEGGGEVTFVGLVERENEDAVACEGGVKLEMAGLSICPDAAHVAAEVTGQGRDHQDCKAPVAADEDAQRVPLS